VTDAEKIQLLITGVGAISRAIITLSQNTTVVDDPSVIEVIELESRLRELPDLPTTGG